MGQFQQTATFETSVSSIVVKEGKQTVQVEVLDANGKPTGEMKTLRYSIGDKGYIGPDGQVAFPASTATDDAIKALYAAVQADIDANPTYFEWAK